MKRILNHIAIGSMAVILLVGMSVSWAVPVHRSVRVVTPVVHRPVVRHPVVHVHKVHPVVRARHRR